MQDLDRLYDRIKSEMGKIDILVANVGSIDPESLVEVTEKNFDQTFGINVRGFLFTVQKALPLFTDGGAIVLISSIAAFKGIPRYTAYSAHSATKASVRSFVRTWTAELRDRGIRVNAISPGAIDTPTRLGASADATVRHSHKHHHVIPGRVTITAPSDLYCLQKGVWGLPGNCQFSTL